jgi:hypothetical protein
MFGLRTPAAFRKIGQHFIEAVFEQCLDIQGTKELKN